MCVSANSIGMEESQEGGRERWAGKSLTPINNIFLDCNSSNKGNAYPSSVAWHNGFWGL